MTAIEHLANVETLKQKSHTKLQFSSNRYVRANIAKVLGEENNLITFQRLIFEEKSLLKPCSSSSVYLKSKMLSKTFEREML